MVAYGVGQAVLEARAPIRGRETLGPVGAFVELAAPAHVADVSRLVLLEVPAVRERAPTPVLHRPTVRLRRRLQILFCAATAEYYNRCTSICLLYSLLASFSEGTVFFC